jgi:hypothetical protein
MTADQVGESSKPRIDTMNDRFAQVIAAIDSANDSDPSQVTVDGRRDPSEVVYSRRMSAMLDRIFPDASEMLKIAARAQHIERWRSPRSLYPEGRIGYLRWRTGLQKYHAVRVGQLMAECGYDSEAVAPHAIARPQGAVEIRCRAQTLEDVICLVFLESYFTEFASKHDEAQVIGILRKTWIKMSPKGQSAALELKLPRSARELLDRALHSPV